MVVRSAGIGMGCTWGPACAGVTVFALPYISRSSVGWNAVACAVDSCLRLLLSVAAA